jgi:hypothetical protein
LCMCVCVCVCVLVMYHFCPYLLCISPWRWFYIERNVLDFYNFVPSGCFADDRFQTFREDLLRFSLRVT